MKTKFLLPLLLCAAACCTAATPASADEASANYGQFGTFYAQRATLFDLLPVDSTTIVMLGNSITNGCEWHELLGMPNVVNRGISGDIVAGVDTRLEQILSGRPAKIFLMIGVNDVSHDLTADSIASGIDRLAGRIQAESPATQLYLQSCLPINNSYGRWKKLEGREQVVRDINSGLRQVAERRGLTYIDLYTLMADEEGNLSTQLTNDGLHLLGPAYLIWRDAILPYVK